MRLDQYLAIHYPYSRSFFAHIIARGGISINNTVQNKKSYQVKDTDKVEVDSLERYVSPIILEETPDITIPVIYETAHYLIIHKPKGVLSHPNSIRDVQTPSVVGFLYHRYKTIPSIGNFIRAGLVHRLDKETDGLMILVKSEKGLHHFKNLFQQKSLAKTYEQKEAVPLKKIYRASHTITKEGKDFLQTISLPHYINKMVYPKVPHSIPKQGMTKLLSYKKQKTSITTEIEILTGRTHQIRYHFASVGLPIIGDYIYNKIYNQKKNNTKTPPLQLTASKIVFKDIEGNMRQFEI